MGGKSIAAQFPPEAGGGYLGFVEVHHQIHCVVRNLTPLVPPLVRANRLKIFEQMILWQHVYKDYYSSRSEIFQDTEETLLLHLSKHLPISYSSLSFPFSFRLLCKDIPTVSQ